MVRYAITNRPGRDADAVETADLRVLVERWSQAGVEFMQLRERGLERGALRELARSVVAARDAGGGGMRVLVHGATVGAGEAAVAAGADGVHLPGVFAGGALGERVRVIRERFGGVGTVVSLSCHTVEEVRLAGLAGVDLVLFGPVFGKVVDGERVGAGVGLEGLRSACAEGVPVLALGGVSWETAGRCVEAGAVGVAGIRMFAEIGRAGGRSARAAVAS